MFAVIILTHIHRRREVGGDKRTDNLADEIVALKQAIQAADDATVDADIDWGDPDDEDAARRFWEAVRYLRSLEAEFAELVRKACGGRTTHDVTRSIH